MFFAQGDYPVFKHCNVIHHLCKIRITLQLFVVKYINNWEDSMKLNYFNKTAISPVLKPSASTLSFMLPFLPFFNWRKIAKACPR